MAIKTDCVLQNPTYTQTLIYDKQAFGIVRCRTSEQIDFTQVLKINIQADKMNFKESEMEDIYFGKICEVFVEHGQVEVEVTFFQKNVKDLKKEGDAPSLRCRVFVPNLMPA